MTSGRAVVGRGTLTAAGAEERRIHPEEEEAGAAWSRPTGATFRQRQVAGEAAEVRHCRDCGEGCGKGGRGEGKGDNAGREIGIRVVCERGLLSR